MVQRVNRREQIVNNATEMFMERGYTATSIRQIADSVGVTEAAIYYHFKDGKRELLQAVLEAETPDFISIFDHCEGITTLQELLLKLFTELTKIGQERIHKMRWIVAEFPNLTPEERALFQNKHLRFHTRFVSLLEPFIKNSMEADRLAWILTFAMFGYGFLMWNLQLESIVYFPPEQYIRELVGCAMRCCPNQ